MQLIRCSAVMPRYITAQYYFILHIAQQTKIWSIDPILNSKHNSACHRRWHDTCHVSWVFCWKLIVLQRDWAVQRKTILSGLLTVTVLAIHYITYWVSHIWLICATWGKNACLCVLRIHFFTTIILLCHVSIDFCFGFVVMHFRKSLSAY